MKAIPASLVAMLVAIVMCTATDNVCADEPLEIDTEKQLLVDDHFIASMRDLMRVLHPATKVNEGKPVRFWQTGADAKRVPMEASIYASPMYDPERGVFRMWCRVYPGVPVGQSLQGSDVHKYMRYGYCESNRGVRDFLGSR